MRFIIAVLTIAATAIASVAQQKADIKVTYTYSYATTADTTAVKTRKMTLLCNAQQTKYFNEMSEYCDSMTSTPEGKKTLQQVQMAAWMTRTADGGIKIDKTKPAPNKVVYTYIFKDFSSGKMTVYDEWGSEQGYYEEPTGEQQWTLNEDSVITILGYECLMAECDYHGRHWTAWFTPEIPVQDGPWKLHGLPGLILRAKSSPTFMFEATGIESTDKMITPIYQPESYSKVKRLKALADEEYYQNNKLSILQAKYNVTVLTPASGIKQAKFDAEKHALETDYR